MKGEVMVPKHEYRGCFSFVKHDGGSVSIQQAMKSPVQTYDPEPACHPGKAAGGRWLPDLTEKGGKKQPGIDSGIWL